MEEKNFEFNEIAEIFEIIENQQIVEFADLIDYVLEEETYASHCHMEVICDNAYVIVEYIESKKRILLNKLNNL